LIFCSKESICLPFSDNFSFNKTKYESVEIEVLDYKPDTAYLLVNRLVELYNEQVKKLQDAQVAEGVKTLRLQLSEKGKQIDSLEQKINDLRVNFGILDYESQAENITKEIYKMLGRRSYDPDKLNELKKERDQLEQKGGEFERLRQTLFNLRQEYSSIRLNYEQQYKELLRNKSYSNIVVNAYKSDKKVYPVRWLICVIFVGSIMLMAMGVISFMDRVNRNKI
jgi:capsule polysaccharide export protein KpsE/RkpR